MREVAKLIDRINNGKFATINLQNHQIRHVNPVIQLLQNIPRIGAQRAAKFMIISIIFNTCLPTLMKNLNSFLLSKTTKLCVKFLTDN